MGAHESSLLSLLQTETGPSPHSRSPSLPPYFGHFLAPVPVFGLGGAPLPGPEPWRPGSEVLLGTPPLIEVRPDLARYVGAGALAPVPAGAGGVAAAGEEQQDTSLRQASLGTAMVWV